MWCSTERALGDAFAPSRPQEPLRSPKAGKSPTCFSRRWDDSSSLALPRINLRSFLKPRPGVAVPWREEQGGLSERLGVIWRYCPPNPTASPNAPAQSPHASGTCPCPQAGQLPPRLAALLWRYFFLLCPYDLCGAADLCPVQNSAATALKPLRDFPVCAGLNYGRLLQPPSAQPTPQPTPCSPRQPPPASSDVGSRPSSRFPSGPTAAVIYFFLSSPTRS